MGDSYSHHRMRRAQLVDLPVACSLDAASGAARLARWRALAEKAQVSVERTPDHLVVRYRSGAGVQHELETLAEAERECCPFAAWEVSQDQEQVILRIRSDAQGLAAIASAFGAS